MTSDNRHVAMGNKTVVTYTIVSCLDSFKWTQMHKLVWVKLFKYKWCDVTIRLMHHMPHWNNIPKISVILHILCSLDSWQWAIPKSLFLQVNTYRMIKCTSGITICLGNLPLIGWIALYLRLRAVNRHHVVPPLCLYGLTQVITSLGPSILASMSTFERPIWKYRHRIFFIFGTMLPCVVNFNFNWENPLFSRFIFSGGYQI